MTGPGEHGRPVWLTTALVISVAAIARGNPTAEGGGNFREVLMTAGVEAPALMGLASEQSTWDDAARSTAHRILNLLKRYDDRQLDDWMEPASKALATDAAPGALIWLEGAAHTWEMGEQFSMCQVISAGRPITVISPRLPGAWPDVSDSDAAAEPVKFRAVVLRLGEGDEQAPTQVLANWIQWRPTSGVPRGWLTLAAVGFDVALLDEIRHRRPFVSSQVSREADAFYSMLAAATNFTPSDLATSAQQEISRRASEWERLSAEARQELKTLGSVESAAPAAKKLQRRIALAQTVLKRGESGLSSVAPMFLTPDVEVGRLVVIDGMARRAVRVAAQSDRAAKKHAVPRESYFEIEVFTADSENMPVVCCVAELPAGFPTGDLIREPVRVAGFFFKNWVYRSRKTDAAERGTPRQLAYAPIVISPRPIQLAPASAGGESRWGFWAGVAFLLALGGCAALFGLLSRRDRLARRRNRRYDAVYRAPDASQDAAQ